MPEYITYESATGYIQQKFYSVDPSVVAGLANLLQISRDQYNTMGDSPYWIVATGVLRAMTAGEITTYDALQASLAVAAENARRAFWDDIINNTKVTDFALTKVDSAIDAIANLADAKVFFKRLARFLVKYARNI